MYSFLPRNALTRSGAFCCITIARGGVHMASQAMRGTRVLHGGHREGDELDGVAAFLLGYDVGGLFFEAVDVDALGLALYLADDEAALGNVLNK